MTGPEHYAEAERLMVLAESCDWTTEFEPYRETAVAAAQVHATLAQAASTIDAGRLAHVGPLAHEVVEQWRRVGATS